MSIVRHRFWPGAVLISVLAVSACTDLTAYREVRFTTNAEQRQVPVSCAVRRNGAVETPTDAASCKTSPGKSPGLIEKTYRGGDGRDHSYSMAFVEFDDQGWFWDRSQMEGLISHLVNKRGSSSGPGSPEDFLILVYTHGWRHNATPEDGNVKCFSRLVERFDVIERNIRDILRKDDAGTSIKPRHVVGVYVGWRGLSTEGLTPWELASFWERKSTAERVGHGGVTELLVMLNELRGHWNPERKRDKTQLIVTGHSFGGKVVYSALSQLLVRRSRQIPEGPDKRFQLKTATSFGDLVVLVNPAFEGALYEPLFQSAVNRCYPEWQRPISLIVTSVADQATRKAFPLGQTAANLFEGTRPDGDGLQWDALTTTVGHMDRYQTHKLEWIPDLKTTDKSKQSLYEKLKFLRDATAPDPDAAERQKGISGAPHTARPGQSLPDDCAGMTISTAEFEKTLAKGGSLLKILGLFNRNRGPERVRPDSERAGNGPETYFPSKALAENSVYYGDTERGALVLTREPGYSPRYPYFVVRTDGNIIEDHNKFYTPKFIDFLLRYFIRNIAMKNTPDVAEADACKILTTRRQPQMCPFVDPAMCGVSCWTEDEKKSCSALIRRKASMPVTYKPN